MTDLSPSQTDRATSKAVHDLGSTFMLHKETSGRAEEHGYDNPFAFYFAGRGGVLGDVEAEVVYAAFGWFSPTVVTPMWEAGVAVHGAREAARRYSACAAAWGRDHLAAVAGIEAFPSLAEKVVAAAQSSGLPLFAGWRAEPRVDDAAGRSMQLIHVLREWRGANHLIATTASGLTPLQAILACDGSRTARFFGWPEPFDAVTDEQRAQRQEAETLTNRLCASAFEALDLGERSRFVELVEALFEAGTA